MQPYFYKQFLTNSQNFIYNEKLLTPSYTVLLVIFCFLQSINFLKAQSKSELFTVVKRPVNLTDEQNEMLAKIKNYQHLKSVTYVKIGDVLSILHENPIITFHLPNDTTEVSIKFRRLEKKKQSDFIVAGTSDSYLGNLLLIKEKGLIFGEMNYDLRHYQIYGITEDLSVILEFSENRPREGCNKQSHLQENSTVNPSTAEMISSAPEQIIPCQEGGIDFLGLYTSRTEQLDLNIKQRITTQVQIYNTGISNSGIPTTAYLNIVGFSVFDTPPNSNPNPFRHLREDFTYLHNILNPMDMSSLRYQYKADIVGLFTHTDYPSLLSAADDIDAEFPTAYVIIERFADGLAFAHEIGHLLGGLHQTELEPGPGTNHGFQFSVPNAQSWWQRLWGIDSGFTPFGTIMCNPNEVDGVGIRFTTNFSNPDVKNSGVSTGRSDCCNVAAKITSNHQKFSDFYQKYIFQAWISGTTYVSGFGLFSWEPQIYCGQGPFTTTWEVRNYLGTTVQQTVADDGKLNLYFYSVGSYNFRGYMDITMTVRGSDGKVAISNLSVLVDLPPAYTYYKFQNPKENPTVATPTKNILSIETVSPNPVNNFAFIDFDLKQNTKIKMSLIDSYGKEIMIFIDDDVESGHHRQKLDLVKPPSGIYILRTVTETETLTKKIIVSH